MDKDLIKIYLTVKLIQIADSKNINRTWKLLEIVDLLLRNCSVEIEELRSI